MREREARQAKRRRLFMWAGAGVVAIVAVIAIVLAVAGGGSSNPTASGGKLNLAPLSTLGTLKAPPSSGSNGFEGVPIPSAPPLAGRTAAATGSPVDGIRCQTSEQLVFSACMNVGNDRREYLVHRLQNNRLISNQRGYYCVNPYFIRAAVDTQSDSVRLHHDELHEPHSEHREGK